MAIETQHGSKTEGPDGSIFLFTAMSEQQYDKERFAMLLGRGEYRHMDSEELEDAERELKLRRALTDRALTPDSTISATIEL